MISIIIVNFNSEDVLLTCLESVFKQSAEVEYEVIIVSNSSVHSSLSDFASQKETVTIIENASNVGYGAACNIGAEYAKGEYIFILNPDTLFVNNVLKILLDTYTGSENIGVLAPQTVDDNMKPESMAIGDFSWRYYVLLLLPVITRFLDPKKLPTHFHVYAHGLQNVPIVNGHALFINRSLFKQVGMFDEQFFMYWEENDLCLRIRALGKTIMIQTEALMSHYQGSTVSKFFSKTEIIRHQSQEKFLRKYYPHHIGLNRFISIIGYSIRLLIFAVVFDKQKAAQYWSILRWYIFRQNLTIPK